MNDPIVWLLAIPFIAIIMLSMCIFLSEPPYLRKFYRFITGQHSSNRLFDLIKNGPRGTAYGGARDCIVVKDHRFHKKDKKSSKSAKWAERLGFTVNKWEQSQDPSLYDNQEHMKVYYVFYKLGNKGAYVKYDMNDRNKFHWMVVREKLKYCIFALLGGLRSLTLIVVTGIISGAIGFFIGKYLSKIFPSNNGN